MAREFVVGRYDYAAQFADLESSVLQEIHALLVTGGYILGSAVSSFEGELARYLGGDVEVIGVNSGTDALVLALDGLGIGPGDEVITVANTFHSTALAIRTVGARPILVDCTPDSFLIDLGQAEHCIGARTKAILPVHIYGQAVDMARARELCDRKQLLLVEDCAQAIGTLSGQKAVGTTGDAGCWSFAPSKNLAAAGDAGAITVRDHQLADRLRLLRHFGQRVQNDHELRGYNSRLDSIQALVLSHKLPRLNEWNNARIAIAERYRESLSGLPIRFQEGCDPGGHSYHLFQVRLADREQRDRLLSYLQGVGVDAVVRYPHPIHLQAAFADMGYKRGQFPVAEALSAETLCLPLYPSLEDKSFHYVCDSVRSFFESA